MTDESWISRMNRGGFAATDAVKKSFPMEWAIDGFLPATGTTIWFGAGATGKTQLLLSMVAQVARPRTNEPQRWLGADINVNGRVLVLSAEDLSGDLHRRLGGIIQGIEPDPAKQAAICSRIVIIPFLGLTSEEYRAKNPCLFRRHRTGEWVPTETLIQIERHIQDWNQSAAPGDRIVGVVMDSATTMAGFETTQSDATTNFLFYLNRLCVRLNLFWSIIGHTQKDAKIDPDMPHENAVARLRGSAMWSTTPRSVVEVRLAVENEDLGDIREVDRRDVLVVSVVKANSHQASRHPRYLKRIEGVAFEDITHLGPKPQSGGMHAAASYSDTDRARLLAVLAVLRELEAEGTDGKRLSSGQLTGQFTRRRGTTPEFQGMDLDPSLNVAKAPRGGLSWCLLQIQKHHGVAYIRGGYVIADLAGAEEAIRRTAEQN